MVRTRSQKKMDAFEELIDKKLSEFKIVLLQQVKESLDAFFDGKKTELNALVTENNVKATANMRNELMESINAVRKHVDALKAENSALKISVDDLQQYIRRPNIKIFRAPVSYGEKPYQVEELVKEMLAIPGFPVTSLDRAHRIGKVVSKDVDKNGTKIVERTQPIIARFTTFRDRTLFYRARDQIKKKYGFGVSLDLTADRYVLLKELERGWKMWME